MKKIILILMLILFVGADIAWAQEKQLPVFSSSLGGGGGYYGRRGVIRRGTVYGTRGRVYNGYQESHTVIAGPVRRKIMGKKTVIHYDADQIALNEKQMEELMPIIQRIQEKKTTSLDVIGIARNYNVISKRQLSLDKVLLSYAPNLRINYREISGPAVVDSNNNTVEFVEYR
ncbi:MAG: hypothetical protein IJV07_02650 [Alphaproteobacteria bacterium]|nr:hypothetical protein [Alphaproteobacteria bacterium]